MPSNSNNHVVLTAAVLLTIVPASADEYWKHWPPRCFALAEQAYMQARAAHLDGCIALMQIAATMCPCEPQPVVPYNPDDARREMDRLIENNR